MTEVFFFHFHQKVFRTNAKCTVNFKYLNKAYKTLIIICPAQLAKRRFVDRGLVPARLGIETDQ